jgi:hypothetical protein
MKLAMTAILPAQGFNDEATCLRKVIRPMLSDMRADLREHAKMTGTFRISILIDTLEGDDKIAEAQSGLAAGHG